MDIISTYLILVVLAALAVYFAWDGARNSRAAQVLEGENDELRMRVRELAAEVRRLRDASGLPSQVALRPQDDELMPIRARNNAARTKPTRAADTPGTVVLVTNDAKEEARLTGVLSANGYTVLPSPLGEVTRHAQEMSTAAILVDLRDAATLTGMSPLLSQFAADPLTKEIPVFALVGTSVDKERLVDDGVYAAAFVVPTDIALVTSALGAAIIRRKTRARRAEAGRVLSAAARG